MNRKFLEKYKSSYVSHSDQDTVNLAKDLAAGLKAGDIIALIGDIGTGKTTFVKAIAKALGISETVSSPTFTIVREYRSGKFPLFHFDVYRLSNEDEFYDIGAEEYLYGDGITIIEWADIVEDALPLNAMIIEIKYGNNEGERIFNFSVK